MLNKPNATHELVTQAGGELQTLINWTWALFTDDTIGQQVFKDVCALNPDIEHRGYSMAQPDSANSNLHKGGFRFR